MKMTCQMDRSATYVPVNTAARRSTKDWIPSAASRLFITLLRISGMIAIAAWSPALTYFRPAAFGNLKTKRRV
jgi:ABC-type phosphate transport system auxiliary subunit